MANGYGNAPVEHTGVPSIGNTPPTQVGTPMDKAPSCPAVTPRSGGKKG